MAQEDAATKDASLTQVQQKLAEAEAKHETAVQEHAGASSALKAELEAAQEEHATTLQSTVDQNDAAIAAREQKISELEAVMAKLKSANAEKEAELECAG